MLTGMAIPQPDASPTAHQSMSWPKIDILCADHAMLKKALPITVMPNENFEKNGEGHMWFLNWFAPRSWTMVRNNEDKYQIYQINIIT